VQQTTVTRELNEVNALNAYIHARLSLDNAMGRVLESYHVGIDEAKKGVVGREPDCDPGRHAFGRHACRPAVGRVYSGVASRGRLHPTALISLHSTVLITGRAARMKR